MKFQTIPDIVIPPTREEKAAKFAVLTEGTAADEVITYFVAFMLFNPTDRCKLLLLLCVCVVIVHVRAHVVSTRTVPTIS